MDVENVKKNNTKPLVLTIIGALIVLLIAVGVFYKIKVVGDPVSLTTTALKSLGNGLDKNSNIGKTLEFMEEADVLEMNLTGDVTLPMDYGKLSIDMLIEEDVDDAEAIMDLDLKIDGADALYLEGQLDKSALYFAFQKNASKYYYLSDIKYPEVLDEIDYEDFLDIFIKSIEESITKENFQESKKDITVNKETINATQYSLNVNQKLITKITNRVIENVEKDEDLIEDLAVLFDMTESEIREKLESNKTDLNTLENPEDSSIIYNIYVYKNTAVRYEFIDSLDEASNFQIDNYKYFEVLLHSVDSYGDELNFTLKEESGIWNINVDSTDLKAFGTIDDEKYDITITSEDMNVALNGTQEFSQDKSGITYIENGKISISQDGASIEVPYSFNVKLKEINRVNKKNTTNRVDINNMTEAEEAEFSNALMQIPILSTIMTTNEQQYNYAQEDYYSNYNETVYGY